jgi:3-deoxy-manno-octulosonate cytidylyltransferase (CMP-KDO synthetase)
MRSVIIIPARYGSTRFPGKPLALIAGKSLVRRVYDVAVAAGAAVGAEVVVATDDARILEHVQEFGGRAVMTPAACRNGTERALAAVEALQVTPDVVVNLQGDAPLTPPWVVAEVLRVMAADDGVQMATPAVRFTAAELEAFTASKAKGQVGGTTVTFDQRGNALYFSKSIIPFVRNAAEPVPVFRHIGLYAYRLPTLRQLVATAPTPLEEVEGLEQLRALESGIPVRVVPVDTRGRRSWPVDSPEDVAMVEAIIAEQGELV